MKHPYAEILIAIAEGKEIEHKHLCGNWVTIHCDNILKQLETIEPSQLRVKQEIIIINGITITTPEREPLKLGQTYYVPNLCGSTDEWEWNNNYYDNLWLKSGIIHLTKEDAFTHQNMLLSFTQK